MLKDNPRAHWSVVHVHRQKEDRERRNNFMIKLEHVDKYFGDLHVLKDVNLEVD